MTERLVVGLGPVDSTVVGPVLGEGFRFIAEPDESDLANAAAAIVRASYQVDAELLDRMPALLVIARTGVGTERVDLASATARGIPVVVTPGSNTRAVAEGTLALTLSLVKRLPQLTAIVREGRWDERSALPVGDLDGARIGIAGFGRIGRRVAELAEAFGMDVSAYDLLPPPPEVAVASFEELVSTADVLSLHLPLTADTHHMLNERTLAMVKPGCVLVNCGRGGLIDHDAVLEALLSGQLAGVGLDVFDEEPPQPHPLFDHPAVVLTPHVMGLTVRATVATFVDAARGVVQILEGGGEPALANPEALQHEGSR